MRTDTTDFDCLRELGGEQYQAFLDAGYQEAHDLREDYSLLYKVIRDESERRLYSINISVIDWTRFRDRFPHNLTYSPEVQFNIKTEQQPTFKTSLHFDAGFDTQFIEDFFAKIYSSMNCQPYDSYDSD